MATRRNYTIPKLNTVTFFISNTIVDLIGLKYHGLLNLMALFYILQHLNKTKSEWKRSPWPSAMET